MKAILLAGGYAKRLWPLTRDCPKSLLPVAGKPMIDYILDRVEQVEEIEEVFLSTNRRFEAQFKEWLETYRDRHKGTGGKEIELVIEETREEGEKLGSIGALDFLIDRFGLEEDLLVVGGDNLFDFDLRDFVGFYKAKGKTKGKTKGKREKSSVVLLYDMREKERVRGKYGVLEVDADFRIVNSEEKPAEPKTTLISTACYIFTKSDLALVKEYLAAGNNPDAIGFFVSWLCKKRELYGLVHDGLWFDIGSFEDYERANAVFCGSRKTC